MKKLPMLKNLLVKCFNSRILIIFWLLIGAKSGWSQSDIVGNRMQLEFEQFRSKILNEHAQFKNQGDSIFLEFLGTSWQSFDLFFKSLPVTKKPVEQPIVPDLIRPPVPKIFKEPVQKRDSIDDGAALDMPVTPKIRGAPDTYEILGYTPHSINFYDAVTDIYIPNRLPYLSKIASNDITSFFSNFSSLPSAEYFIEQMMVFKNIYTLNDWGYLKFIEIVSKAAYPYSNEQILMQWSTLLKSGYDVKIGYNPNGLYLLIATENEIYNSWYLTHENISYFIVSDYKESRTPAISIHKTSYPKSRPMSMMLEKLPTIGTYSYSTELTFEGNRISVPYNELVMNFLKSYPLTDLEIYFSTPLSNEVLTSLDSFFQPLFRNRSNYEIIEILLSFVQSSFAYKTDKEQFGREKFYFADEMFYYPYSDCEDRAILMARLVKHYTSLSVIGLSYPGHVNLAVKLPFNKDLFNIKFENNNYIVCDPTYRNAPVGYQPPEYKDITPQVIILN